MSFFDRQGTNFARVPNPEQTIGQLASPTLYAELFRHTQAKIETVSLEGVPLLTAFVRSPLTGWTVAAGLPVASLTAPLWQALTITLGVGAVMLAIGLSFALTMAARIAQGEALHSLLINELNHRVKNTLATVQSIAAQTFRHTPDANEAKRKFEARLVALGRAHNVLSDEKWESADLGDVVADVLEPLAGRDGNRLRTGGGLVRVPPRSALLIAMVLHELATNAAKYGAWSNRTGTVTVELGEERPRQCGSLRLTWRETGGPPVRARSKWVRLALDRAKPFRSRRDCELRPGRAERYAGFELRDRVVQPRAHFLVAGHRFRELGHQRSVFSPIAGPGAARLGSIALRLLLEVIDVD